MRRIPLVAAPVLGPVVPLGLVLVLVLALASCAHLGDVALRDMVEDSGSDIHSRSGQKIDGYTKTDDIYYQYHGYVRLDGADSLRFSPVKFEQEGRTEAPAPPGAERFTLPVSDVKSLNLD